MSCPTLAQIALWFDGELDPHAAAGIESHLRECGECQAALSALEHTRSALRAELGGARAPASLRTRVGERLDAEDRALGQSRRPVRAFWVGTFSGIAASAAALVIAYLLLFPSGGIADEIAARHVASLLPGQLISVESSSRHTVRPWFAGHADVSPVVEDFSASGFSLLGGRADRIDGQRAAVIVYRHGAHIINVFSWRREGPGRHTRTLARGYHLWCWPAADLQYCAASDAGWDELGALVGLLQGESERDRPR
jgi:anti-sigma factor RsiW